MSLPSELIAQFAKITNDNKEKVKEGATVYGTYRVQGENAYVQIDGSDVNTPVATTTQAKNGDRVTVFIKDHHAIITGNLTDPAVMESTVSDIVDNYSTLVSTVEDMSDDVELIRTDMTSLETSMNAFEDSIAEAKKYATNYINYVDGLGLVVGNRTGSVLGKNIVLESTGVDIRDGSTILARYTGDTIWLGRNSGEAVIDLCNGMCQIYHDIQTGTSYSEMVIEANTFYGIRLTNGHSQLCLHEYGADLNLCDYNMGVSFSYDGDAGLYVYCRNNMISVDPMYITLSGTVMVNNDLVATEGWVTGHGYYSSGDSIYANKVYISGASTISGDPNARLAVSSPYQIGYSSGSSRKFKHDIKPVVNNALNPNHLYDIEVVQFKYNDDYLDENDQRYREDCIGFIAEQVNEVYPIAADRETGEPRNWEMRYIIPPMLALIQQHKKEIDELKDRIETLETKEVS